MADKLTDGEEEQLRDLIAIVRTPASAFKKADPMDVEAILEKAS